MAESKTEECVLIVGDWFVDEHWVFGLHRSPSSSRTGSAHYRALNPVWNEVRAFCGAGRSAFFLHHVRKGKDRFFPSILGLGFWHRKDTEALKALFAPDNQTHSPYRLADRVTGPSPEGIDLINLNNSFLEKKGPSLKKNPLQNRSPSAHKKEVDFTDRIIRIYRQGNDGRYWYERFDWEPRRRPVHWKPEQLEHLTAKIKKALGKKTVSIVIIKDLLKDVVNPQIVGWLANDLGRKARWYVSSKKWNPDWQGTLKQIDCRLYLVPQIAAKEAMLTPKAEFSEWLTRAGNPSQEAINAIEEIYKNIHNGSSSCNVVVLPGGFSFLSFCADRGGSNAKKVCVVQPQKEAGPIKVAMGGDSILFPALCACMEYSKGKYAMAELLRHAMECTYDWVAAEGKRVAVNWHPRPKLLKIATCQDPPERFQDTTKTTPWDQENEWWRCALDPGAYGVVTTIDGRKQLQLWRSMSEVDGYVCCETTKRTELRRLLQGIKDFSARATSHGKDLSARATSHTAALIVADPGSGKTFLVKKLAKLAGLQYLTFNIANVNTRSDIVNYFDEIRAKQEDELNSKMLVFFDEINAKINNDPVYGSFLSVLEDGSYVRDGKTFHLEPCVWIFAGTQQLEREDKEKETQKGSDLASRLGLGTLNLNPSKGNVQSFQLNLNLTPGSQKTESQLRLERVYLGAVHLRRQFSVTKVSEPVLKAFLDLPMQTRVRDIVHFIENFIDIQYNEVRSENVPKSWPHDEDGQAAKKWASAVDEMKSKLTQEDTIEKADIEIVE
jgi:ATPase family associated with various cellular activities (AAA)